MNTIITIGREYGSGGREIGKKLADKFGIGFYDKELLKRAAAESGMCAEIFENHDEKPTNSFLYNLVLDTYSFNYSSSPYVDMPISHKVFLAQFDTIKKIAEEGPCVIVGRCADYALADFKNCLNVFVYAKLEKRIERIKELYPDYGDTNKIKDMIMKTDKQRSSYYNFYSSKKWGASSSYNISIDSSVLGIDGTVDLIAKFVEDFETIK